MHNIIHRDALRFRAQLQNIVRAQNIAICGLYIALYIVLSAFNIRVSTFLEIRFAFLILAAAGMFGGPMMGMTVGACSDIISGILSGQQFFFGFTFNYALLGFVFGLIFYRNRPTIPRAVIAGVFEWFVSVVFTTYWLFMMYGTPLSVLIPTRLVKCSVLFVINCAMLYLVLGVFSRVMQALHLSPQN